VALAGRSPPADPDAFESYEISLLGAKFFYENLVPPAALLIPVDSRTFASPTGDHEYVFYRMGGLSWMMPYAAGLYALAVQVDPSITPDRFWTSAEQTARPIRVQHNGKTYYPGKMIDPVALIKALQHP
jgi:hypothetical protein